MRIRTVRSSLRVGACGMLGCMVLATASCQSEPTPSAAADPTTARPLLLERNEGELRVRRIPGNASVPMSVPSSQFMLKVSPKNNGSQHFVLVTEELRPGATIRTHKHLMQDEIVLIQTGTAHVRLGDMERDVHAGGLVFIPTNTWIGLQNVGNEPISLVAIFSSPGFDDYLRCASVPASETATAITRDELKNCAHDGHAVYQELEQASGK